MNRLEQINSERFKLTLSEDYDTEAVSVGDVIAIIVNDEDCHRYAKIEDMPCANELILIAPSAVDLECMKGKSFVFAFDCNVEETSATVH